MLSFLAAAVVAFAPAADTAGAAPDAPAARTEAAAPAKEKRVCRTEEVSGTRLSKKVCSTKSEDEERKKSSREALEGLQRNAPGPKS